MLIRWNRARNLACGSALLLALWSAAALAWERHSAARDPVQVWSRQVARQPYQQIRAEAVVAVPVFRLLRLLQDANTQHQWLPYTHRVEVLEHPAPHQTRVRFESESRWPFAARDAVTLFEVSQPRPDTLRIDMLNQPDAAPLQPGVERIREANGYWLLTAQADCTTEVRYEAGSHWGGTVPQWLVNRINRRVTASALENLQHWAPRQTRSNIPPDFLQPVPRHAHCE